MGRHRGASSWPGVPLPCLRLLAGAGWGLAPLRSSAGAKPSVGPWGLLSFTPWGWAAGAELRPCPSWDMPGPPLSTQVSPRPAWVLVPRGASPTSFSPLRSSAQTLPCPQPPLPRLASKRGGGGGTGRQTGPCRGKCRPWRGPARCHGRGTAWGCGQGAAVSPGDCPPSGAKAHTQGCGARPVGRRTGAEGGWHGGRGTREKGGTWDTQGPVRAAVVTRRRSRGRVRVRGRLPVSHGAPARRPLGPPHKAPPPRTPPHHGPAATRRYGRRGGGRGTHQPGTPPPPPPNPGRGNQTDAWRGDGTPGPFRGLGDAGGEPFRGSGGASRCARC